MSQQDLIDAVRKHALACYEQGWGVVLECYDDADILDFIGEAGTPEAAIKAVAAELGLESKRLNGFVVTNRDVDGTSRWAMSSFRSAAKRYEEMSGQKLPVQAEDWLASGRNYKAVGTFGNVVTIAFARTN